LRRSFRSRIRLLAVIAALGVGVSTPTASGESDLPPNSLQAFDSSIKPFLTKNCVLCHNAKNATAGLNLARFTTPESLWEDPAIWESVSHRIMDGTMPPKGLPRPPMEQRDAVLAWIRDGLEHLARNTKPDPGRVTARRLNRFEYNNTIRDLLGVDFKPAADFPADDAGYGFDNIGDVLSMSPILMEKYVNAAWDIAQRVVVAPTDRLDSTVHRLSGEDVRRLGKKAQEAKGPLAFPIAKEAEFEFPADAEYEILVKVSDRRQIQESPGLVAVVVGDGKIQTFQTELRRDDENAPNEFGYRTRVPAGKQILRAATVDENLNPFRYTDESGSDGIIDPNYFEVRGPFGEARRAIHDAHRKLFICTPKTKAEQPACAEKILSRLVRLAYRRPVTAEDLEPHLRLVAEARAEGFPFEEQIRFAVQSVLVSPHFLFRIERNVPNPSVSENEGENIRHLTPIELASRLSYFLWSSMPDEELLTAAENGRLQTREEMLAQVRRMLADPKASAFTSAFAGQWLRLRNLDQWQPDRDLFPEFDNSLRTAMKKETELLFESLLHEDGTIDDLLAGDFTFLNERLAKHYGIPGVEGEEFRKVSLKGTRRGGVLTHASVLTISSYPTRTSPVLRGVWLLENILGSPPPPPPPDVPELDSDGVGNAATLRERMERHRTDPTCAACHSKMDPLGFGLENFDAIGRYRETEGTLPIDTSGTLPNGVSFDGPDSMKRALLEQRRDIARNLAEKMLTFALGRGVERYDRSAVEELVASMESRQYRISTLVEEICWSMPFRMRRLEGDSRK
jgi:mono/diheme cytochrome c family protein